MLAPGNSKAARTPQDGSSSRAQPSPETQEREVAAAQGTVLHDELAPSDVQVDVVQRAHRDRAGLVGLDEAASAEKRLVIGRGHGPVCRGCNWGRGLTGVNRDASPRRQADFLTCN